MRKNRRLFCVIDRQKNWKGYDLRDEELMKEVSGGRFDGKRPRGRRRNSVLNGVRL